MIPPSRKSQFFTWSAFSEIIISGGVSNIRLAQNDLPNNLTTTWKEVALGVADLCLRCFTHVMATCAPASEMPIARMAQNSNANTLSSGIRAKTNPRITNNANQIQ